MGKQYYFSRVLGTAFKAGLVAAAAVLIVNQLWPELFSGPRPVVELTQGNGPLPALTGSGPASYAQAVETAAPSVVNIHTSRRARPQQGSPLLDDPIFRYFFGETPPQQAPQMQNSLGSGVILSEQGYMLTNHHVIDGADEIRVMLQDGRGAIATLVGTDPEADLAVLRIELEELPQIQLGDSDRLRVGDVVLAIGNPFGVGQTVTQGIVSATGRNRLGINTFENFIQTDAAINPGNSGGALINAYGELIGINTAIFTRSGGSQGIGFAIPASLAVETMRQIIEFGRPQRGWLGVEIQDITPQLAQTLSLGELSGVLISGVVPNGPASRSGLRPGDVILAINGQQVSDTLTLLQSVARLRPEQQVELEILRDGEASAYSARIGERPNPDSR